MVQQIRVNYIGPGDSPKYIILNFTDSADLAAVQPALDAFLDRLEPWWSNQYQMQAERTVRKLNTNTGALVDEVQLPSAPPTHLGTVNGQPIPDATAVLFRWNTGVVVAGRFLRGRMFASGLANTYIANGNLTASMATDIADAANDFCNASVGLGVWSRAHGTIHNAVSGSVWSEFATQRGRRG